MIDLHTHSTVSDGSDPPGLLRTYRSALASGSYLALSHATADRLIQRKIEDAGHGPDFLAHAFPWANEQWIDETFRSEPGLAHQGTQCAGAA